MSWGRRRLPSLIISAWRRSTIYIYIYMPSIEEPIKCITTTTICSRTGHPNGEYALYWFYAAMSMKTISYEMFDRVLNGIFPTIEPRVRPCYRLVGTWEFYETNLKLRIQYTNMIEVVDIQVGESQIRHYSVMCTGNCRYGYYVYTS